MFDDGNRVRAEATVLRVEDTGWTRGDGLGVKLRLTLRVEPPDEPWFERTRVEWVAPARIPRAGEHVVVRYDPDDPEDWRWDPPLPERPSFVTRAPDPSVLARLHPAADRTARLGELTELRDDGIISPAEYEIARDQVLDEL